MKNTFKNIQLGIVIGLVCAITLALAGFDAKAQNLRENLLRLHIIANSDSSDDQDLKLKVRDAILRDHGYCFDDCKDLDSAVAAAQENLDNIRQTAQKTIEENGFEYRVKVSVSDSFFPTRVYDDCTLPAGVYKALKIEIGEACGKNWWCVVFPSVCVPSATTSNLTDAVDDKSAEVASHPQKYIFKFKTVEIYEDIKQRILS